MTASPAQQIRRQKRLREVEKLYLDNYTALEIWNLLGKKHRVTYQTIRQDICDIRKAWADDNDELNQLEGSQRYLAATHHTRRLAISGKFPDLNLVHKLDKELARLSGVRLASDEQTLHVDIQKARDHMDQVLEVVFRHVEDRETQEAIVADLEKLGEGAT